MREMCAPQEGNPEGDREVGQSCLVPSLMSPGRCLGPGSEAAST